MDLKHELITSFVGVHGRTFKAIATNFFDWMVEQNFVSHEKFVAVVLKIRPWILKRLLLV